jgi:hypothetical protein
MKMKFLYLLLALPCLLWAQPDAPSQEQISTQEEIKTQKQRWKKHSPMSRLIQPGDSIPTAKWALKYSIASHLDFLSPSAQAAVEYRFHRRWSAQLEGGYVYHTNLTYRQQGLRLRPEIRRYFGHGRVVEGAFAFDLLYRYLYIWAREPFLRYNGSYQQIINYLRHKHNLAFHTKIYGFTNFGPRRRLFLEWGLGLGLRSIYITEEGIPADAVVVRPRDNNFKHTKPANTWLFLPSMVLSLKFGVWL